jgi:hypothetical protein
MKMNTEPEVMDTTDVKIVLGIIGICCAISTFFQWII